MATGTESRTRGKDESAGSTNPEISVCESAPGRSVFIESGNTDGWIASDTTLEVTE
jgi:hypothetical protein